MEHRVSDQDPKTFVYEDGMYAQEMEDGRYKLIPNSISFELKTHERMRLFERFSLELQSVLFTQ